MNQNLPPSEIRLSSDKKTLRIVFSDQDFQLSAELLRVESPSAEVKGHGPEQKKIVAGKKDVAINSLEAIGSYAIQIEFSDGHRTGIYTFSYLRELGENQTRLWQDYLRNLEQKGLTR
jgi:DUF971 family protein